jgi:predicted PurR-regulated permease PerM
MKKKNNYAIIILTIALVILIGVFFYVYSTNKQNEEQNKELINNTNEITNTEKNELSEEEQQTVFNYLQNNISEISPEKEVLGGSFYITSIDFLNGQEAIIEYEDGHIAFKANVQFQYINQDNITINNFEIIQTY